MENSHLLTRHIPPMLKIVKYEYPKLGEDPALFETWRSRFIASICATELMPLYDRTTQNIVQYGFYIEDDNFMKYEVQLYSRLLQALPDSSSFIRSHEYLSKGIALWHALLEDNNSSGAVHNTHILLPALYTIHRKPHESIDTYWNRFNLHVSHIRRDKNAPTLSQSHLRLQFLITLGGSEFSFLRTDWENSSLDTKWLKYTDGELKSALRLIQQAKSSLNTNTIASNGYATHGSANALTGPTTKSNTPVPDKDPRIDTLCTLVAEQAKLLSEHSSVLANFIATDKGLNRNYSKYCWTHGGCNHESKDCRKKSPGHQDMATWNNRMNGSERNIRRNGKDE